MIYKKRPQTKFINRETAFDRGEETEKKVFNTLNQLKNEGVITDFGQTMKFSKDDYKGIDFYVYLNGKKIKIQVKSSFPLEKERKYLERNGIFLLVCRPWENDKGVRKKILKILNNF